jgi:putative colanic acid biosynthesis acetyltransferase WcaF
MSERDPVAPGGQPRSLRGFSGAGYDRGRGALWQIAWFTCQNLLFFRWWCPKAWRPRLLRWFGAQVGDGVFVRHRVRVLWPWKLTIGDDCWIGEDVWLLNLEPIAIGNDVCLSQGAFLCTGSHDRRSPTFEYDNGPITVGNGSWIAAQALVLRGVRIGPGAVIGARSVVTRDVPANVTVRAAERW